MRKPLPIYISGIVFVSTGLIPIARNIFTIGIFNDAPIFFLVGGIWLLLIIILFNSSKESQHKMKIKTNY